MTVYIASLDNKKYKKDRFIIMPWVIKCLKQYGNCYIGPSTIKKSLMKELEEKVLNVDIVETPEGIILVQRKGK